MEALNQIQSWLNANKIEKARQGCEEILQIEPGNQRALALMKQAESRRFEEEQSAHEAGIDPLENLEVEKVEAPSLEKEADEEETTPIQAVPQTEEEPEMDYSIYQAPKPSAKKMFLAMVIPAVLVVVIGGGIIYIINNGKQKDLLDGKINTDEPEFVETHDHSDDPEIDTSYLAENETRVTDLTEMANAIDEFWIDNNYYPNLSEVEALLKAELNGVIPTDPRQGDFDVSGDPYGYMYAVYKLDDEGHPAAYILSAIFQDSKGEAHPWAQGASTKNYDDYRDIDSFHVIYIGD